MLSGLFFAPFSMFLEFIYFDRQIEDSNLLFAYSLALLDFFMMWADTKIQRSLIKVNPEKYGYSKYRNMINVKTSHLTSTILNKNRVVSYSSSIPNSTTISITQSERTLQINSELFTKNIPLLIEFLKLFFFVKSVMYFHASTSIFSLV